jgi:hypothetical protein
LELTLSPASLICGQVKNHSAARTTPVSVITKAEPPDGTDTKVHHVHRGTKQAAGHANCVILSANDDRARATHTVAALTDRDRLPTNVAAVLDRHDKVR